MYISIMNTNGNDITVLSANCQGLCDRIKRKDVFSYLREKRYSIYCLQDTHFSPDQEQIIKNEWGYNTYFSSFKSNARGVAILLNNNFEFKVFKEKRDLNGNFLALDIAIDGSRTTLISLYGPNKDTPGFYELVVDTANGFGNDNIIICGDFNLVLEPNLDYDNNYKHVNNPTARNKVLEIIQSYSLIDIFREHHPETRRYTWRKVNPIKQARLDFFLISETLLPSVNKSRIEPGYRSDHSIPTLSLTLNEFKKGKGLWKFNNSLLFDSEYLEMVKSCIEEVKLQYCLPVYNFDSLKNICNSDIQFLINDQLFLETLLMEIRGRSISYSSFKKKQANLHEDNLKVSIELLEAETDPDHEKLDRLRKDLETIRVKKVKGSLIRSRAKWIEEGEKPSSYFLNLENRNFTSKIIPKIQADNGDIISKQEDVLSEVRLFYEKLYKFRETDNINLELHLENCNIPKLSDIDSDSLEGKITFEEAGKVLRGMKNNKSPGSDGFTSEFFKVFWKDLGSFVVRSLNHGFLAGQCSVTQRHGIIVCIPKGDKPRHFLKNWRPITLLNITYKIASGVISQRIKTVLSKIINEDQTGFLSGRYIGENIRTVYDVMQYLEDLNIPGMLMLVDFEKAFDSVSWKFIDKVLEYFKFGPEIRKWIKLFNNNVYASINQGGNLSERINIERGCRQGDPISPYIFIICAEVLAARIRNNNLIKGIDVDNVPILNVQYADDTGLILDGSERSLNESLSELNNYAKISGLNINTSKTQVIWLGSCKYSDVTYRPDLNLQWGKNRFTFLGIEFSVDLDQIPKMNFDKKIVKLKSILTAWKRRSLTPIGKINIIKSLLISQLNYLFITLPNPPEKYITMINSLLFDFLWNGKCHKIKTDVIIQNFADGGLKMIDVYAFIHSLKLGWIRRLFMSSGKWYLILKSTLDLNKLYSCGKDFVKLCISRCHNKFWKDVFKAWDKLNFSEDMRLKRQDCILKTPLWYNNDIKVNNKFVFYPNWYMTGILTLNDLMKNSENLAFLSYDEFIQKFGINTNFLQYHGLILAIKRYLRNLELKPEKLSHPFIPQLLEIFFKNKKGVRDFYRFIITPTTTPTGTRKWNLSFNFDREMWLKIYNLPFKVTKNSKLIWFQVRIIHHILVTNTFLHKIRINPSPMCTLCNMERETIIHCLWECKEVQTLLHKFETLLDLLFIPFAYNKESFLFGIVLQNCSSVDNEILIIMKHYIYKTRCLSNSLNINALINVIKDNFVVQKYMYNSLSDHGKRQFDLGWRKWKPLLDL